MGGFVSLAPASNVLRGEATRVSQNTLYPAGCMCGMTQTPRRAGSRVADIWQVKLVTSREGELQAGARHEGRKSRSWRPWSLMNSTSSSAPMPKKQYNLLFRRGGDRRDHRRGNGYYRRAAVFLCYLSRRKRARQPYRFIVGHSLVARSAEAPGPSVAALITVLSAPGRSISLLCSVTFKARPLRSRVAV
jgi:hypothetical protein